MRPDSLLMDYLYRGMQGNRLVDGAIIPSALCQEHERNLIRFLPYANRAFIALVSLYFHDQIPLSGQGNSIESLPMM
jgi:hypothetical protein